MRVVVAGGGAWGTALAHVAKACGHHVKVWRRGDGALNSTPDAVVLAVPAQAVREVAAALRVKDIPVIIAAKGIERSTGKFMVDVVRETVPGVEPLVLSGPSFAGDVLRGLPTAVVVACRKRGVAALWAKAFSLSHFRIYHTDDVAGVELGGALKNVLAIACGISDGKGFGESARAALITRGFAEMNRLAVAFDARPETLTGLSGLGDLLLTCASGQSRNYAFGIAIGKGYRVDKALAASKGVVEGAATAAIAARLAGDHGIDMPITQAVHEIIDRSADPDQIIRGLLARPAQVEF